MIYFISGHLDLNLAEFEEHYEDLLWEAHEGGASFVVGDAKGADSMAQQFLAAAGCRKVIVFHMFEAPRNNVGHFPTKGGYSSDKERDAAMTAASDSDIAWVRIGREKSGTAKNLKRRQQRS